MAFTNWTTLRDAMRDDLANGSWRTKSYTIGGKVHVLHSLAEMQNFLDYVENKAAEASATTSSRVNYARFRDITG